MTAYPGGNSEFERDRICENFADGAEKFVSSLLKGYRPSDYGAGKVIHDCVWGTVTFYPWELRVIDSPLLQRLRRINQLGLAEMTYPSAQHSRFEHTLGVAAVLSKMISSINQDENLSARKKKRLIPDGNIYKLRMAALLHDVGHCFFSHVSESAYGVMPEFAALREKFGIFRSAQPHEILGYMIINTPSFAGFMERESGYPFGEGETAKELLSDIGRMIVGAYLEPRIDPDSGERECDYYMTQLINGQFDADSLDYLRRDSYATGIALSYHIDRFLYKLRMAEYRSEGITGLYLTVASSGISTVEEMVFSKLQLTRHIYRHQKVMATESLVADVVEGLQYNGKLRTPCEFLYWCDDDITCLSAQDDPERQVALSRKKIHVGSALTLSDVVGDIFARRLPKKALVVNFGNVVSVAGVGKPELSIASLADTLRSIQDLRGEVLEETNFLLGKLGKPPLERYSVHAVVPKLKMAKDFTDSLVASGDGRLVPISEIVDLNDWAGAFANHSWNAYVYAGKELPFVSVAAVRVLERYGIAFDRNKLFVSLKEADGIKAAEAELEERGIL
ncbi:MAG: HD domain-containing protein [Clostridiales bacterium]|nr:HD domain-containing protein [Clostridiales bacterium]